MRSANRNLLLVTRSKEDGGCGSSSNLSSCKCSTESQSVCSTDLSKFSTDLENKLVIPKLSCKIANTLGLSAIYIRISLSICMYRFKAFVHEMRSASLKVVRVVYQTSDKLFFSMENSCLQYFSSQCLLTWFFVPLKIYV